MVFKINLYYVFLLICVILPYYRKKHNLKYKYCGWVVMGVWVNYNFTLLSDIGVLSIILQPLVLILINCVVFYL